MKSEEGRGWGVEGAQQGCDHVVRDARHPSGGMGRLLPGPTALLLISWLVGKTYLEKE